MLAVLPLALLTGCVSGETADPGGRPHRDLAATPESLAPVPDPVLPAASSPAPGTRSPGAVPPSASVTTPAPGATAASPPAGSVPGAGPGPGSSPGSAGSYRRAGGVADGANDAEGAPPPYADLAAVVVEDDGTNARVTVTFRGDVPARLPADETMGVGVDFFRSATQVESDYQLFADGQPEGWFAYLQTPSGFVRYPGRFGVGGRRLEFVVPWSALGAPRAGSFSSFADWTRDGMPGNAFGEDHAPNLGTAAFSR